MWTPSGEPLWRGLGEQHTQLLAVERQVQDWWGMEVVQIEGEVEACRSSPHSLSQWWHCGGQGPFYYCHLFIYLHAAFFKTPVKRKVFKEKGSFRLEGGIKRTQDLGGAPSPSPQAKDGHPTPTTVLLPVSSPGKSAWPWCHCQQGSAPWPHKSVAHLQGVATPQLRPAAGLWEVVCCSLYRV